MELGGSSCRSSAVSDPTRVTSCVIHTDVLYLQKVQARALIHTDPSARLNLSPPLIKDKQTKNVSKLSYMFISSITLVVKWLELWPQSKKVLGLTPPPPVQGAPNLLSNIGWDWLCVSRYLWVRYRINYSNFLFSQYLPPPSDITKVQATLLPCTT